MTHDGPWDVAVVGAGPAGATAALAALHRRPGARVLLLDRADFPRDKACGDGVAPHVLDVLAAVGATTVAATLQAEHHPVDLLELSDGSHGVARRMRRPALVVPRAVLDEQLVRAAVAAGAVLRRHRVRDVSDRGDHVVLDGRVSARVVVAADGAGSPVRRALGLPGPTRVALGLRAYTPTTDRFAGRQVIRFGSDRSPSYAWSFDRGDGWCNIGYGEVLHPGRPGPNRQVLVDRLESLLPGTTAHATAWRAAHLPLCGARWRTPRGRVLLAGDAAGLVNPLTGEGIHDAVASGACAGSVAVSAAPDPGQVYARWMRRRRRGHQLSTSLAARIASSPAGLRTGLVAADADADVFDDLVELGLADGAVTPSLAWRLLRYGASRVA